MQSATQDKSIQEVFKFYDLFRIVSGVIPEDVINERNASKAWKYGYDEEYDVIIISKDGTIGQIYEIEHLLIAIPLQPDISEIHGSDLPAKEQMWQRSELPDGLKKYKSLYGDDGFLSQPKKIREEFEPYIEKQFELRQNGFWFMNNGIPHWLTGQHWMYLQWSPIDVGYADYWLAGMISYYHWEACRADYRSYGQNKVKCRRSGWSHEASSDVIEVGTSSRESHCGIISKTGKDAKSFFIKKTVSKFRKYPFFFKPLFDGNTNPKEELAFRAPSEKVTNKNKGAYTDDDELNTYIDWQTTQNNSYDSEKLKMVVEDEAAKWGAKLGDILEHWDVIKQTLRSGVNVVGKCKMGTTVNPPDEGGASFKKLWDKSDVRDRMTNGETQSGLYRIFIRAEHNFEGFIDVYGYPVLECPAEPVMGIDGRLIKQGAFRYFDDYVESLKRDPTSLNEWLRKNPRSIEDAFRIPGNKSPFNLANIFDQISYNDTMVKAAKGGGMILRKETQYSRYNLAWKDGKRDTTVELIPDVNGRFYLSWIPPKELQNNIEDKNGEKFPLNTDWGCLGCDPYDISKTTREDKGSEGAIIGLSRGKPMCEADYGVFLEYLERPFDVSEFFDDVIKACVFFGMPILPERDKARLLYEMKERGYRKFVLNRPDKEEWELTGPDKELGGYPGKNEQLASDQIILTQNFTHKHLGMSLDEDYRPEGTYPAMPFNRLLRDMELFDPTNRTKSDLTIAFFAAILGIQPRGYYAKYERKESKIINIGLTPVNKRSHEYV